ncbi:MAG: hypothetical protein IJU66_02015 [Oscillospiraceae bacterium]|nr:hypothetical protein [Oscillospiraceae bacterium]
MLKILIKKQFAEVFRAYFFDPKKNRPRSKAGVIGWFAFFAVIMVGLLGGVFTMMSISLCRPLADAGMGWLYFALTSGVAILLGAFGSVFNTFSTLYLSKDNDLLLSMPIPVKDIVGARLANVYLMGAMYAATASLPALIVYWAVCGATAPRVVCGVLLFLIVTLIVLLLSVVLGYVVAKISLKLKNKSFFAVLLSLVFVGAYYFFYFRASDIIRDIIANASVYGERIKGSAYVLYLFGRIGEGDWGAAAAFLAAMAAVAAGIWTVLLRSFTGIVTSSGRVERVRYVEKAAKAKSPFGALLGKEFARFTSSPNYMLNTGLGTLLVPASGVLLLIKGREIIGALYGVFSKESGSVEVLLCALLCVLASINDMAAPSVSLEGKSLWIAQSLPVEEKTVLRAKMSVQLLTTLPPVLFAAACAAAIVDAAAPVRVLLCVTPAAYAFFLAAADTLVDVKMPILNWTNELAPIKQSGAVVIALFGSWLITAAVAALYLLLAHPLGAAAYLGIWAFVFAAAAAAALRWLDTRGAAQFRAL